MDCIKVRDKAEKVELWLGFNKVSLIVHNCFSTARDFASETEIFDIAY